MGETPLQCVNRIRLNQAIHLMHIDSTISITQIAHSCGFNSLSAFSRCFQNQYSIQPSAYARNIWKRNLDVDQSENKDDLQILSPAIVYFPDTWIFYSHTSVFNKDLPDLFQSVKALSEVKKIEGKKRFMGLFTHIHLAFNSDKDTLNYYAGVEIDPTDPKKFPNRITMVPGGRYACFSTQTPYSRLYDLSLKFKTEWMDNKGLHIRDTFGFEILDEINSSSHYPYLRRRLFFPVK